MKKTRGFLHFWDFNSSGFSWLQFFILVFIFLSFFFIPKLLFIFFHLFFVFWLIIVHFSSFLFISHHFLYFFHGFLVFCNIFRPKNEEKVTNTQQNPRILETWLKNEKTNEKNDKKMINKWKNSRFFAFLGFQLIWLFLAPIFHFGFHFFIIFFHSQIIVYFFSFVFRILINHCPFFIISIHFSSFSLLFPWISCVLQHFSTKKWGKVTNTQQNPRILETWLKNEKTNEKKW